MGVDLSRDPRWKDDLYGILGVKPNASTREIVRAYKDRRKELDVISKTLEGSDVDEQAENLEYAREVLRDQHWRQRYDQSRTPQLILDPLQVDLGGIYPGEASSEIIVVIRNGGGMVQDAEVVVAGHGQFWNARRLPLSQGDHNSDVVAKVGFWVDGATQLAVGSYTGSQSIRCAGIPMSIPVSVHVLSRPTPQSPPPPVAPPPPITEDEPSPPDVEEAEEDAVSHALRRKKLVILLPGPIGLVAGIILGLVLTGVLEITPVATWVEHASARFDAGTSEESYDSVKQLFRFAVTLLWRIVYVPWLYVGSIVVLIAWFIATIVCLPFAHEDVDSHLREDSWKVAGFSLAWSIAWTFGFGTLDWSTIQDMIHAVR